MLAITDAPGPMYFNDRLREDLNAFDADGNFQEMSVLDYLAKGKGLAECFNGRVRVFNFLRQQDPDYLKENRGMAKNLLDQYQWLKDLTENVRKIAEDFYTKLKTYDSNRETILVGKHIVMNYDSANELARRLAELSADLQKEYLTSGTAFTYLTNRIEDLRTAYNALPPADTKV